MTEPTRRSVAQIASFDAWVDFLFETDPEMVETLSEDELRRIYEETVEELHSDLASRGTVLV